ncbi:MAG: outer membrane lipoprotein-sorting protein, partial [Myxococcota bacterium]
QIGPGWCILRVVQVGVLACVLAGWTPGLYARATEPAQLGASATLAEIEACVSRNLPNDAGVIEFSVEAIDRSGAVTLSRAEIRWTKDDDELARILLRVSEPAKTAGTAILIMDRESDQPEFYLRLPEIARVKRVRSKRLRGPVLGTDFSFEDLQRLRDPLDRTDLELIGIAEVDGRSAWLLEAIPGEDDGSEYTRVLSYIDPRHCVPVQVDLFERDDRLRKRLRASQDEIRRVGTANLPHVFTMEDLRRETRTIIRIERFDSTPHLPVEQFTKRALQASAPAAVAR